MHDWVGRPKAGLKVLSNLDKGGQRPQLVGGKLVLPVQSQRHGSQRLGPMNACQPRLMQAAVDATAFAGAVKHVNGGNPLANGGEELRKDLDNVGSGRGAVGEGMVLLVNNDGWTGLGRPRNVGELVLVAGLLRSQLPGPAS